MNPLTVDQSPSGTAQVADWTDFCALRDDHLTPVAEFNALKRVGRVTGTNFQYFPPDAGFFNVMTYGATGKGVIDDTVAIQSAIYAATPKAKTALGGGLFATVFFPPGTYLVSAPLKWMMPNGVTWHSWIAFQGSGNVVIKLKDNCPGYQDPTNPYPVLWVSSEGDVGILPYSATTGAGDDAFGNYVFDMQIDVGVGNAGAVGVNWLGNNISGMTNVVIRSSDPGRRGFAGISDGNRYCPGPSLFKDVAIYGFNNGIYSTQQDASLTFDGLELYDQISLGINNVGIQVISIDRLTAPNFTLATPLWSLVTFGDVSNPALTIPNTPTPTTISSSVASNVANYVKVIADLTGVIDATEAIQAAIDSGHAIVYLPFGRYLVSGTLYLRGSIQRFWGCGSLLLLSDGLPEPVFRFDGTLDCQLDSLMIGAFTATNSPGAICVQHNSSAQLILKHIMAGSTSFRVYQNTSSGTGNCFIDDVSGNSPDIGYEIAYPQNVWAHQLDPEGVSTTAKISNAGGQLRILGLCCEYTGVITKTWNGGRTEVVGMWVNPINQDSSNPAFLELDSASGSYAFGSTVYNNSPNADYVTYLKTSSKTVLKSALHSRGWGCLAPVGSLIG